MQSSSAKGADSVAVQHVGIACSDSMLVQSSGAACSSSITVHQLKLLVLTSQHRVCSYSRKVALFVMMVVLNLLKALMWMLALLSWPM